MEKTTNKPTKNPEPFHSVQVPVNAKVKQLLSLLPFNE